ncbi:MAG: hypothetical protein QNL91_16995 [Candidatus Krumholzibacteria bacterium]|nr:hypothetical protein [Candidatus Krumholzibacteria bacterium]
MKWTRNRFLLPYVVLLAVLAVVGCTSKKDPSETLVVCGNHSCGELVMVTTDTSSDGFHYLNPAMSPDGSHILFTADWWAIPSDPKVSADALFVINRQLIILPNQVGVEPTLDLESQGGVLVELFPRSVPYGEGGNSEFLAGMLDDDKANPSWEDDSHLIFSMRSVQIGNQYRLCRADISDPALAPVEFLFMEPADATAQPRLTQHLEGTLSADQRWMAFTRSSCTIPDSFETCTGAAIWVLDMATAGVNDGYDALAFPVTGEYSRMETPRWSPDGAKIVFSGGMDVAGAGTGAGTEIFTVDFDTTGLDAGTMPLDHNVNRLTFTTRAAGDPISGILNRAPVYANNSSSIFFISTRRAPAITLHDRNLWRIPADGTLDPELYYFTRSDDVDPTVLPDGRILLSSSLGFPTEMLNRLEEEAYQAAVDDPENEGLDEVQLRALANDERRQLEFFEGVMSHIYTFSK